LDDLKKDIYDTDIDWIIVYNIYKEYYPEYDEDSLMMEVEKIE
jgi:hypothetical protein